MSERQWRGFGDWRPFRENLEIQVFHTTESYARPLRKIAARAASIFIVFYGNYFIFFAIFGFSDKRAFANVLNSFRRCAEARRK